jgi:hypothetical protein
VLLEVDAQLPEGRRYRFMMCQSVLWIDVNGSKLLMPTCVLVSKPSTATHCQFSLCLLESLFLWANNFSNSVIHLHGTNPAAKPISSLRHLQDPEHRLVTRSCWSTTASAVRMKAVLDLLVICFANWLALGA